jgi:uroporphyrin-3 C-methyltransferase
MSMDPILPTADEDARTDEPGEHAPKASPPVTPFAKPVSRGVAVVLAAVLAGVVAFAWLDARNGADSLRSEVTKRLVDEDAALALARARDSDQSGELRESQAKLALLETRMSELLVQQSSLEAQFQDIAPSRDEIVLTEVEQMLLLASQQLSLAANVPAAIAALQLADGRLAGTNRAQLTPLRRALAQDMDRLRAVPNVDVPGIALKLDRALAAIDALPLAQDERLPEPPPAPRARDESSWFSFLRGAWEDVKTLVRIEVSDRAAAPLVPPAQQYFLRENLRLRLLSARVALLSRDETSFKSDMAAANAWVKQYFDTRAKSVQALSATLTQLGTTVMPVDMPDINASLTALRTIKASRERIGVRAVTAPSPPARVP